MRKLFCLFFALLALCLPAQAIELPDGEIVTGKTSNLLGCCAAMLFVSFTAAIKAVLP